ncbi:insulinase family protein [Vibrio aquaticus]|uniref:Insulinase family protein n=1 Tax=Vibrio aquaticus TaxID=2496559 RepID=A0A432D002_9VIBR|nr:insulinase family protein [Vibrio aquaticus]RTZ17229.1 insulinase family protein [Vibrio aquaticus]
MKRIFLLILVLLVGCTHKPDDAPIQEQPGWTSGTLSNGLRYHIYPNNKEAVALRMYVHAGSVNETDEQKGYAHFLEHMAFNGSRNFSSNDVVDLFEHSGLTFGADINAYTSYYETVYKLDLPDTKQVDNGIRWMRDIADGLNLSSSEIEKEKGVIKGEMRRSRPENKSLSEKYYDHLIKGTPLEDLDPLGTTESVSSATSDSIRAFYKSWYQPQLTEIVVTGAITAQQGKAMIEQHFGSWEASSDVEIEGRDITQLKPVDFVEEIGEYDFPSLTILIDQSDAAIKTRDQLYEFWLDDVVQQLIWQRLDAELNKAALPVQSLYSSSYYINYRRYSLLSLGFVETEREKAQRLFTNTLASLRDYGVTNTELEAAIAYYHQQLTTVDQQYEQLTAVDIAESRVDSITLNEPIQSKQDYQQSLEGFVEYASSERVNAHLKQMLSQDYTVILGAADAERISPLMATLPKVKASLAESGTKPLAMTETIQELAAPGGNGKIVSEISMENGFTVWTLSNGIEVWFERDEKAGESTRLVYSSLGGKAALAPNLFAASHVAINTVNRSGIGDFDGASFDSYLRRNNIEVYPFVGFTDHGLELGAPKDKLADTLNTIYNIATNVNVSERQLQVVSKETIENINNYMATPIGKWTKAINHNSYLPDSFHYSVSSPDISLVTAEQIKEVHHELFAKNRNNKLVIVADLDAGTVREMVRHYIGSIPLEPAASPSFNPGYILEPKPRIDLAIYNEPNTYYIARFTNPQLPPSNLQSVFMDDMIQRLISKRLTEHIREDLGLDYAPDSYATSIDGEPSSDWLVEAQVAPSDIRKVEVAVDKVIDELVKGVSQSDVEMVAKQLSVALQPLDEDIIQRSWFYARYLVHGYGVDALKDIEGTTQSITQEAMNQRIGQLFGVDSIKTKYVLSPKGE